jgi:hypothetical protein
MDKTDTTGSLDAETLRKGQIITDALRTIASGKKDYGENVADMLECREIAMGALGKAGCL